MTTTDHDSDQAITLWTGTVHGVDATIAVTFIDRHGYARDRYLLTLEDDEDAAAWLDVDPDDTVQSWCAGGLHSHGLTAHDLLRALAEVIASRRPLWVDPSDTRTRERLSGIDRVRVLAAAPVGGSSAQEAVEALVDDLQVMADDTRLDYEEKGNLIVGARAETWADAADRARDTLKDLSGAPEAAPPAPTRTQRLAAFQAAVAARTAGLDDDALNQALNGALFSLTHEANRLRALNEPILVSRRALLDLFRAHEVIADALEDRRSVITREEIEDLSTMVQAVIPWGRFIPSELS